MLLHVQERKDLRPLNDSNDIWEQYKASVVKSDIARYKIAEASSFATRGKSTQDAVIEATRDYYAAENERIALWKQLTK